MSSAARVRRSRRIPTGAEAWFGRIAVIAVVLVALAMPASAHAADGSASGDLWGDDYNYYVEPGSAMYASVYLSNDDVQATSNVTVTFTLPAGSTYVSATAPTGACTLSGSIVTCDLAPVDVWDYASVRIQFTAPSAPGEFSVTYDVASPGDTWTMQQSGGRLFAGVYGPADVDLYVRGYASSSDGRSELRATQPFVISLRYDDYLGRTLDPVPSATVVLTLPAGLAFTGTPGAAQVPPGTSCAVAGQQLTCSGPVPTTSQLTILVGAIAAQQGSYEARAAISTSGNDLDPDDNARAVLVTVHAAPPTDACTNIEGFQSAVPSGLVGQGTTCVVPVVTPNPAPDVCANVAGAQAGLPTGFGFDSAGRCMRPGARRDVLRGGSGIDRILGAGGNDWLRGSGGPDQLFGGTGADRLEGQAGNDLLDGGLGIDMLSGGIGRDRLQGGGGNDVLDGGLGMDRFSGGAGNDVIRARDRTRRERIACGAGRDTVYADRADLPARDCEVVRRG